MATETSKGKNIKDEAIRILNETETLLIVACDDKGVVRQFVYNNLNELDVIRVCRVMQLECMAKIERELYGTMDVPKQEPEPQAGGNDGGYTIH